MVMCFSPVTLSCPGKGRELGLTVEGISANECGK